MKPEMRILIKVCRGCFKARRHGEWVTVSAYTMRKIIAWGVALGVCPECIKRGEFNFPFSSFVGELQTKYVKFERYLT